MFGALSNEVIESLVVNGKVAKYKKGEVISFYGKKVSGFSVVLKGDIAFYVHCEDHDVLTRHFQAGEQLCFDLMIGLLPHYGTEVAAEETIVLDISSEQFFDLHVDCPLDFGLLMINLARELSREINMLEKVIEKSSGWIVG